MPERTETHSTVRGRVITKRMGRVAVVCVRNGEGDEYDSDVPMWALPKGIEDGAEIEIRIKVRGEK